jgi:hypothetical protein
MVKGNGKRSGEQGCVQLCKFAWCLFLLVLHV